MKTFDIKHGPTYASLRVEIDTEAEETIDAIKSMVEFWTDWEHRLEENDGDYLATFLRQLANKVIRLSANRNLTTRMLIEDMDGEEGWAPMDGTMGIKIVDFDHPDFDNNEDYEVKEITTVPGGNNGI